MDASQDFTSDPQLLLASIDKFMGRGARSAAMESLARYYEDRLTLELDAPPGTKPENIPQMAADMQDSRMRTLGQGAKPTVDITDFDRAQRVVTVFDSVRMLADALAPVRGRRKAVVMFSEGFNYQMTEPFGMRSVSDVIRATQDTLSAAARANVNFYTIDPRALVGAGTDFMQMTGPGMPTGGTQTAIADELQRTRDSLRVLAEETGGFATIDANSLSSAFDRIVDSNSRYYILGYTPPDDAQNGRFHKIDVRVKRPGLKVIARRGYATPRAQTLDDRKRDEARRRAREARRPDGDATSTELRGVLESALQQRGVSVSVQAAPFRNRDNEASVALAIEVDGARLPLSPPGTLEVSFYSVNDQGRAGAGVRKEINLALKPDTVARVKSHGIRLNPRMALAPGRYQLRFGARESSGGQNGSVFYDLIVPDFRKEDLAMSGLLLTLVAAQQTPTADPDPLTAKQLPGAVTSRRDFPVGDTLAVYAEVYAQQPITAAEANRRGRAADLGNRQRRVHGGRFDGDHCAGAVEHFRAIQTGRSRARHVPFARRSQSQRKRGADRPRDADSCDAITRGPDNADAIPCHRAFDCRAPGEHLTRAAGIHCRAVARSRIRVRRGSCRKVFPGGRRGAVRPGIPHIRST